MIHLDKIFISNARRFGKDVEIDFGKGATILLAPNGTGKTTVFEAIELAITGKIDRLGYPPIALIRDKENELDVRIDFSNNQHCEVNFRKGQNPKLNGNHYELFANRDSIPYLLRLTHLLEQRGKNWFVDSEEKTAGNFLDQLSIGQELNHIISKKRSISITLNKEYDLLNEKLSKSITNLEKFKNIIEERNKVVLDIKLIPLIEISNQIQFYYKLTNKDQISVDTRLNSIVAFAEQTKSVVNQRLQDNDEKKYLFTELNSLLELFEKNKDLVIVKQREIDKQILDLKDAEENSNKIQANRELEKSKLNFQQNKIRELNELKNSYSQLDLRLKEKERAIQNSTSVSKQISTFKENLKSTNQNLENISKLIDQHNLIDLELEKCNNERAKIEKLIVAQNKWKEESLIIQTISDITIPEIENQKLESESEINKLNIELGILSLDYAQKLDFLNSLRNTTEAIQEAVTIIASNLPNNEGKCPVCEAEYEPDHLKERISHTLKKINPMISDAVIIEKKAFENLEQIKQKVNIENIKLQTLTTDLQNNYKLLNELNNSIGVNILPHFPNCQTAKEALLYIEDLKVTLEIKIQSLNKTKVELSSKPDLETSNTLKLYKGELERKIVDLQVEHNTNNGNIVRLDNVIAEIKLKIGDSSSDKIDENILIKNKLISEINMNIFKLDGLYNNCKQLIIKLKELNFEDNESLLKINNHQNYILEKFINVGFSETPSKEKFLVAKNQLSTETIVLNDAKENLKKIDEELSRWKSVEEYENKNNEIIKIASPLTEQNYLEKLEKEIKLNNLEFSNFKEKQKTLNSFFDNANNELSAIHSYIESINPYWSALLKRVLINPRFSETNLLKSGTTNNKAYAQVQANLHNNKMSVANIASEAQLTDLQLTFLLTMAKTHEWTSWKALLLDDPTQHHDLVHASSVFDLLRDYILDLDFQVMMSTHDTMQANFFLRKLQNDGIDAKIYKLKSGDSGVFAECIY